MDKSKIYGIVNSYIAFLKTKDYQINEVYIFGSFAKGHETDDSDIDIAIVLNNTVNNNSEMINLMKYRRNFDLRIEPHPFSKAEFDPSNPFVREIIQTGIKIA